jgi:hypothetical protein
MAMAYFQVDLSVKPEKEFQAELVLPAALKGQDYQFLIVKEGGQEGIVKLEASADAIEKIGKQKQCRKLTKKQMEKLMASYPPPRIKEKYREKVETVVGDGDAAVAVQVFELDRKGKQIIDTVQTVRAGFYMIDVPVLIKGAR